MKCQSTLRVRLRQLAVTQEEAVEIVRTTTNSMVGEITTPTAGVCIDIHRYGDKVLTRLGDWQTQKCRLACQRGTE